MVVTVFLIVLVAALIVVAHVEWPCVPKTNEQRLKDFDEFHAKQLRKCQRADDVNFWQLIVTAVVTAVFLVWSVINGDWN